DASGDAHPLELEHELGKLCFGFGARGACSELLAHTAHHRRLGDEEGSAYLYAVSRAAPPDVLARRLDAHELAPDRHASAPDWEILRAASRAAAGAPEAAASAAERAVRRAFAAHPDLEAIAADCRAMLLTILQMRELTFEAHDRAAR